MGVGDLVFVSIFFACLIYGLWQRTQRSDPAQKSVWQKVFIILVCCHAIFGLFSILVNLSYTGTEDIQGIIMLPFFLGLLVIDVSIWVIYLFKKNLPIQVIITYVCVVVVGIYLSFGPVNYFFHTLAPHLQLCRPDTEYPGYLPAYLATKESCPLYELFGLWYLYIGLSLLELVILVIMYGLKNGKRMENTSLKGD